MNVATIARIAKKQLRKLSNDRYICQINLSPHHDGSAHIEDLPGGQYRYVCTERNHEYNERTTDNPQDILYWIYRDVTFEIACQWEAKNRVQGSDARRLLFSRQLELLRMIGEEYALRRENEIKIILSSHPFNNLSAQ